MSAWQSKRVQRAIRRRRDLDIASDPEFAAKPDDPLAVPVVAASFYRNRRHEEVRVTFSRLEGKAICDLRIFFPTEAGNMQPSRKGIAVTIQRLPDLLKAIEKAYARAIELDLVEATS